jgi:uncharacterized protein
MKTSTERTTGNLRTWKVLLLIFIPPALLMAAYALTGYLLQDTIPSLLLFYFLALSILFPIQLLVILIASKKEYGSYSLRSAFPNYQKINWWKIVLYGALLWGFAGLMTVTVAPLEALLFAPISGRLSAIIPPYFDWTNMEYLQRYPSNILLLTCAAYLILNGFVGPIVEELFFRGFLTTKLSRFGKYAPLIVTVLFSLYHFWSPFSNLFRIIAFYPAAYMAWRMKNIYIAIVFHVLSNVTSAIGFIVAVSAFL